MSKPLKVVIVIFSSLIVIIILFSTWVIWTVKNDFNDRINELARCKAACASGDTSDKTLECQVDDMIFTLDQFCFMYGYNTYKEESTISNSTLFRDFEDKGLFSINFKDGYYYEEPMVNVLVFGPQNTSTDMIGQEIPIRPYSLEVISFRSVTDIVSQIKNEKPQMGEPSIIEINGLQAVEYKTAGICDGRAIELVGLKFNYLFSYDACGKQGSRDYLIETIKTALIVK